MIRDIFGKNMWLIPNLNIKLEAPSVGVVFIHETDQAIFEIVHQKKHDLKEMGAEYLCKLARFTIDKRKVQNRSYAIATWHEEHEGKHLIVTQCKRYIFFQYGPMFTAGLIVNKDGTIIDATDKQLASYK